MTPPDLADVLAEVNRLRAERGLEPLGEMPKGGRAVPWGCPLRHALNVYAVGGWYYRPTEDDRGPVSTLPALPPVLSDFVVAFDAGLYPELVAE